MMTWTKRLAGAQSRSMLKTYGPVWRSCLRGCLHHRPPLSAQSGHLFGLSFPSSPVCTSTTFSSITEANLVLLRNEGRVLLLLSPSPIECSPRGPLLDSVELPNLLVIMTLTIVYEFGMWWGCKHRREYVIFSRRFYDDTWSDFRDLFFHGL